LGFIVFEQMIQTALLVLANLVCPPSLCSRPMPVPTNPAPSQQAQSSQGDASNGIQASTVGVPPAVNSERKAEQKPILIGLEVLKQPQGQSLLELGLLVTAEFP